MPTKKITFGIGLGILLGLLADGFLLTHVSGWLAVFVFPLVLPPLVGAAAGAFVGWKVQIPSPPWRAIAAMALLCPLAVWFPIKVQEIRFRRFAESLPVFPQSDRNVTLVAPLGFDSTPSVSVEFRSTAKAEDMVGYYRDCLIELGWHPISKGENAREWQSFEKERYTINMIGFDSDQAGEHNKYDSVRITRQFNTPFYRSQQ